MTILSSSMTSVTIPVAAVLSRHWRKESWLFSAASWQVFLILVTAILSYPLEAGEMASSKFTFDLFELPMKIAGSEEHLAG